MCRECIRLPENRDKVSLNIRRNDFIFSVESTGCVPAEVLLPKVLYFLFFFFVGFTCNSWEMCYYYKRNWSDWNGWFIYRIRNGRRTNSSRNGRRRIKISSYFYDDCLLKKLQQTFKWFRKKRQLQDSNLRGQSPTDFESVSLTTRTNCLGNFRETVI